MVTISRPSVNEDGYSAWEEKVQPKKFQRALPEITNDFSYCETSPWILEALEIESYYIENQLLILNIPIPLYGLYLWPRWNQIKTSTKCQGKV